MAKKTRKTSKKKKKQKFKPALTNHTIGLLHLGTKEVFEDLVELMRQAAEDFLHTNGAPNDTVNIYGGGHYAEDNLRDLDKLADDLVNNTDASPIVAAGGPQSALAAMDATLQAQTPVVFTTVADPADLGLVPGTNLTGMAGKTSENDPARLKILKAFVSPFKPNRNKVGVLINPGRQGYQKHYLALKKKAAELGLELVPRPANDLRAIARVFQEFKGLDLLGVLVTADAFFHNHRKEIVEEAGPLGGNPGIPTIYQWRSFVDEGGLISYGPKIDEAYEKAGEYVGRILLGELPADLDLSEPGPFKIFVKEDTADNLKLFPVPASIDGKTVHLIK